MDYKSMILLNYSNTCTESNEPTGSYRIYPRENKTHYQNYSKEFLRVFMIHLFIVSHTITFCSIIHLKAAILLFMGPLKHLLLLKNAWIFGTCSKRDMNAFNLSNESSNVESNMRC